VCFSVRLLAVILGSFLLCGGLSSRASEGIRAYAAAEKPEIGQPKPEPTGQPWTLQTPFGLFYGIIPREEVDYKTTRAPGTIIVSTGQRRLYFVLGNGRAIRYPIAVGMEGYGWSGVSTVSAKREWPDWTPTPGILARFPNLPRHMAGGPDNPLGARALYLGASLYRIHGTNEPWKLGGDVSSGCIRLSNDDIIDLYNRTKIGATVIVQQ
jgi:lipoprotein-anchoring transpeptidase ErfK/SrfK